MSGHPDLQEIIARLDLKPHPEGGFYRETFRDVAGAEGRSRSTLIYFLLAAGQTSAWHRVDAVEVWHFYLGAPLRLSAWIEGKAVETIVLGTDLAAGQQPQYVVPAHHWQMAESLAVDLVDWTLVGCSVAPGFEFAGFEIAPPGWQPR
jgi:predicted cupin superfamily sugar epimerase